MCPCLFKSILGVVDGTPWWVWPIFTYLVIVGVKSFKKRVVFVPQFLIIPAVMVALKYQIFVQGFESSIPYLLPLFLMTFFGYYVARNEHVKALKGFYLIEIPGNNYTLPILLLFFSLKYACGYFAVVDPVFYARILFFDTLFTGAFSGFFLGKAWNYFERARRWPVR